MLCLYYEWILVEINEEMSFMFGSELGRAKKAQVVTGPEAEGPGVYMLSDSQVSWGGLWTFTCYK